jgi:hypothetical protein
MLDHSYGGFGFNIPSGNVIQGIEVKIEASTNQMPDHGNMPPVCPNYCSNYDIDVFLPHGDPKGITLGLVDEVFRLGGASDTWNRFGQWTPSDFNNGNFYVHLLAPHAGARDHVLRVDAIQVRVYHQTGGGGGGGGGEI